MTQHSGAHFQRNEDRRSQHLDVEPDQRKSAGDRRRPGLDWLHLFRDADSNALASAICDSEIRIMNPGDVLLRPGEMNEVVFMILSGRLGVFIDKDGKEQDAIPMLPGECLGELSAIDGKPVSALVKALEPSRVLVLTQQVFWNHLLTVPGVAKNLLLVLADRMRRNTESLLEGQRRKIELDYLRQELNTARDLQTGMLPLQQPMFPDRGDVDVAGMMEAASFVGGDLFDAFFVDEAHLFICIGDVSGHGIPAAMFMARTVSLIRIAAHTFRQPDRLLEHVNNQLCLGNQANLFVTLFCGFLNVESGCLTYSNGGHLAPLLIRSDEPYQIPLPKGTALGFMAELPYRRAEITLAANDLLLCFTDGVTEAQPPDEIEFSESRLLSLTARYAGLALNDLLLRIREEVAEYTGTPVLSDDCTLLAVRRSPEPRLPAASVTCNEPE